MSTTETFAANFEASANTTERVTVTERPEGTDFAVERVEITIEREASDAVKVGTFIGQARLAPADGPVASGGKVFRLPVDATVSPTGRVVARYQNPTSTAREVQVIVLGRRL
jgi:hypothetical protein